MGWKLKDDELLDRVAAATAPPGDLETLLADELWSNVFSIWATDLGFEGGDYNASRLHHLWADLSYGTAPDTIRAQYVDPGGASALPWPASVLERFERADNGMDSDYNGAVTELRHATIEALEPYASKFRDDIKGVQSEHLSQPTLVDVKLTQPDMGLVDRVNQATLKDLPEYNSDHTGATVKWFANSQVVLIGDNHPASYYQYLKATGHTEGWLMMMKRGSAFKPGRVEVGVIEVYKPDGDKDVNKFGLSPNQDDIRQAVTDAVGRVSNKEVKHNK
jgi:hypothetical protein